MTFDPAYLRLVLAENFDDARREFLDPLVRIHYAHLVMLAACGIVGPMDARAIRDALDGIDREALGRARFDGSAEDLYFHVERLLVQACGEEVAGRLHTARSRNDIDMTMYRMRQREELLAIGDAVVELRRSLLGVARRHVGTIFAAHTHTQPAQPSTIAHYLMAAVEQLERDTTRLSAAYRSTNRCPLGACAITGTGFPIDRAQTSALLGFDAPTGNTYGSIATVDYLLEAMAAVQIALAGVGRLLQDLLVWSTAEFGALRLADGFVQGSSIMPQKRNPVALEHARAIASKTFAQALAVAAAVHNTPFGDIVDTEDDLQPLVFSVFRDARRALGLVAAAMRDAEFDVPLLERRAGASGITMTELADTLVREHGLAFTSAHAIAGRVARAGAGSGGAALVRALAEASREVTGRTIEYGEARLSEILDPRHFVAIRTLEGGPAPPAIEDALARSRRQVEEDASWVAEQRQVAAAAVARLAAESRAL